MAHNPSWEPFHPSGLTCPWEAVSNPDLWLPSHTPGWSGTPVYFTATPLLCEWTSSHCYCFSLSLRPSRPRFYNPVHSNAPETHPSLIQKSPSVNMYHLRKKKSKLRFIGSWDMADTAIIPGLGRQEKQRNWWLLPCFTPLSVSGGTTLLVLMGLYILSLVNEWYLYRRMSSSYC